MLRTAISTLVLTAVLAGPCLGVAQDSPFPRLVVAVESSEAGVRYRYRLIHSPASVQLPAITSLTVGVAENEEVSPVLKDVPASVASPENWLPDVIKWEHAEGYHVAWTRTGNSSLSTGSELCGFEILMPQATDALRAGPFSLWLGGSVVSFRIEEVSSPELGCAAGSLTPVVEADYRLGRWLGVEVGTSDTFPFVYSNRSNVSATAQLSVEGPMFSLVGPSTLTLAPGGEGPVTVRFHPTAAGVYMGTLRLAGVVGADTPLFGRALPTGQMSAEVQVTAPASAVATYRAGAAAFGPSLSAGALSGELMPVIDTGAGAACATLTGVNALAVNGKVALIDRGTCAFTVKVKNAQNAGAIGVLIADNVAGSPPAGLGGADAPITIPAVRVAQADGSTLMAALRFRSRTHSGVFVTLRANLTAPPAGEPSELASLSVPHRRRPG